MRAAILSLDAAQITLAIDRLRLVAPEAAQQLSLYANRLNYTAMLGAITAGNRPPEKPPEIRSADPSVI
jgi:hypothetical protein